MPAIRTVLFDLDGTLADTAPDLTAALNLLLAEEGYGPVPYHAARAEASHGARALIKLGFGLSPGDPGFDSLRQRFLELYSDNLCRHTVLFPGMTELLVKLKEHNIAWGVVTNKPAFLTDALMYQLGLANVAACVVSGDTTKNPKPHPEPLLYACQRTRSEPMQCLYVGDAERDIEAGRRAGMKTLVALFGYLRVHDNPHNWGADGMIESPLDVMAWLRANLAVA